MVEITDTLMKLDSTPVGVYQPNYNDIINMMNPNHIVNFWPDPKFQYTRWNCGVDNVKGAVPKYLDIHGKSYDADGVETTKARIDDQTLLCNITATDNLLDISIVNTSADNVGITITPRSYDPGSNDDYEDIITGDLMYTCTIDSNTDNLTGTFGFSYVDINNNVVTTSAALNAIKHGTDIININDVNFTIESGLHAYTCRFPKTIDGSYPINDNLAIVPTLTIVADDGSNHTLQIKDFKLNKGLTVKHDKPYNEVFNIPFMKIFKPKSVMLDTTVPGRVDWVDGEGTTKTLYEEIVTGTAFNDLTDIGKELMSNKGWTTDSVIDINTTIKIYELSWDTSTFLDYTVVENLSNIVTLACDIYLVDGVLGLNGASNCKKDQWNTSVDYIVKSKEGYINTHMIPMSTTGKVYVANFGVYHGVLTEEDLLTLRS